MQKTLRWWASHHSADDDGDGDDDDCELHLRGGHPLEVLLHDPPPPLTAVESLLLCEKASLVRPKKLLAF